MSSLRYSLVGFGESSRLRKEEKTSCSFETSVPQNGQEERRQWKEAMELTDEPRAKRREAFAFFLAFFAFPEAFVCAWDWNVEWVFLPQAHGFLDSFLWQSNLEAKVNEKRFKCLLADTL